MKITFLAAALCLPLLATAQSPFVLNHLKSDANGDGKLAESETNGKLRDNFVRVDSDADGFVDVAELEKLEKFLKMAANPQRETAKASLPEGVTVKKDIAYREGNPKWKLDLYTPAGDAPAEGRPALVVVHGGGWKGGDKAGGQWFGIPAQYAAEGYVAISVNYRLHPEVGMLDCIADVKCAVRWLRANAKELGVDPDRIGAYGNSAGAHLVSILGLTTAADGLEGDGPHQNFSSQVQAVCAAATPTDFHHWSKEGDKASLEQLAQGEGTAEERATKAAPVTYVSADAPPFLLLHAKDDHTVPHFQSETLTAKLKAAGTDVTFLSFEDGGHGVFGTKSGETVPAMKEFFARTLKK